MTPIEQYIRQAAQARGINPDIAVRVAKSEGGLNDPYRQAEAILSYGREQSYGPFQLHLPKGLGAQALAAGVDPRKDWQGGVDFALDAAKKGGWGPWFGAKKIGITGMAGINGGGPGAPSLPGKVGGDSMVARDFDPQVSAQTNAPGSPPSFPFGFPGSQQSPLPPSVADYANDDKEKKGPLETISAALSAVPNAPMPGGGMGGDANASGNLLNKALSNPTIASILMDKRLGGLLRG